MADTVRGKKTTDIAPSPMEERLRVNARKKVPGPVEKVDVRPVGAGHYRVNVWAERDGQVKIVHSEYV